MHLSLQFGLRRAHEESARPGRFHHQPISLAFSCSRSFLLHTQTAVFFALPVVGRSNDSGCPADRRCCLVVPGPTPICRNTAVGNLKTTVDPGPPRAPSASEQLHPCLRRQSQALGFRPRTTTHTQSCQALLPVGAFGLYRIELPVR
jgi:hypothetical protein